MTDLATIVFPGSLQINALIRTAFMTNDGKLAGRVAEELRFKHRFTYKQVAEIAARAVNRPVDDVLPEWDALLADS